MNSKKYGVDLVHFTHAKNTAIHASTKVDGNISLYILFLDCNSHVFFPDLQIQYDTFLCMITSTSDIFLGTLKSTEHY